jgi:hypothetical protein
LITNVYRLGSEYEIGMSYGVRKGKVRKGKVRKGKVRKSKVRIA